MIGDAFENAYSSVLEYSPHENAIGKWIELYFDRRYDDTKESW